MRTVTPGVVDPEFEVVDTTGSGLLLTAACGLAILGFGFLYALVLMPQLGFPSIAEPTYRLVLFVLVLSACFLWTLLVYGPSTFIRIEAQPPQPRLSREEMLEELQRFDDDAPFESAPTDRYDLVVQYRLANAEWRSLLHREGLRRSYRLFLSLDEASGTAWVAEEHRSVHWEGGLGIAGPRIRFGAAIFNGITWGGIEIDPSRDPGVVIRLIRERPTGLSLVRYAIFTLLERHGWTIRFRIHPRQLSGRPERS